MRKILLTVSIVLALVSSSISQVAINANGNTPGPSTMLDISSTTKGMRIPRMTSTERKAIADPDMGLLVYDTDKQTIYLFDGVQWKAMMSGSEGKLPLISRTPEGANEYADFGESVAIHGNYVVVGAPTDSVNGIYSGSVYVFEKANGTWIQQAKLSASNGADGDMFGSSVDIYDDIIVVGAPEKSISGVSGKGRVYIFKRTNRVWNQVAGLQASNGALNDKFGSSVCTNGIHIIAGAPYAEFSGKTDAGAAYIFGLINNVWSQKAIVHASDPVNDARFGHALSFDAAMLIVGAPKAVVNNETTGAAYIFKNTDLNGFTWMQSQKLSPQFDGNGSSFGYSVSAHNNVLLVGSPYYSTVNTTNLGGIWRFTYNGNQWGYTGLTTVHEENLYTGVHVVTDGVNEFYSMRGWQNFTGRVALKANDDIKYYYSDINAQRTYGLAIDMHNGQIVITSKNNSLSNRNGEVYFGKID